MKKYMFIIGCVLVCLTGCHSNKAVEITVSESSVSEEKEIDVTSQVLRAKNKYETLKDFGLKHGMLYTSGKLTNVSPVMDEITPYTDGDEIEEDETEEIRLKNGEFKLKLKETDESVIFSMLENMSRTEIYEYLGSFTDFVPVGPIGEGYEIASEAGKAIVARMGFGYTYDREGVYTYDELDAMTDTEFKTHVAKLISFGNSEYNKKEQHAKEAYDSQPETMIVRKNRYETEGPEYQEWYKKNYDTIMDIGSIDFTVDVLPKEIEENNGRYTISKENIDSLLKGKDEDNKLSLEIYGQKVKIHLN